MLIKNITSLSEVKMKLTHRDRASCPVCCLWTSEQKKQTHHKYIQKTNQDDFTQ